MLADSFAIKMAREDTAKLLAVRYAEGPESPENWWT